MSLDRFSNSKFAPIKNSRMQYVLVPHGLMVSFLALKDAHDVLAKP
jgi:hypothetical protein